MIDEPFDLLGELPRGVTVLEASAGTGKTYAIAALATRYVAEGIPLEQLLLVTFTRIATGELRERVRERLASAERRLALALAGEAVCATDELAVLLASGEREQVEVRQRRLARALADFDAATIATTHGFCQEILDGLGVLGDSEPDTVLLEEVDDLIGEVVDDLYVRRFFQQGGAPFTRGQALEIVRDAAANPTAPIEPRDAPADGVPAMRRRLAAAAREELAERKRRMGVITYDDQLTALRDTLRGEDGARAAARLRARFRVVLVDEFQDTDPVQWEILQRAFGGGEVALVLIGDPKQAIYAFRGADVYAYLEAARCASTSATLSVNWRSDQGLLDAYDALFAGAQLGHEGIVHRSVRACEAAQSPRLHGAPVAAPLRLRVVERSLEGLSTTPRGFAASASARELIACDVASEVARLLSCGARVVEEPVRPGHLAVLVRTHRNAALVREALDGAGIPAVINGAGSVFAAPPAREWLTLLQALERPSQAGRARAAALTVLLGWDAARVACAGEGDWEAVHERLHRWAGTLRAGGVAALSEAVTLGEGLPARVLGTIDGERTLTDLRHVAQLLHAAAAADQLGVTALIGWLRERIAEAELPTGDEERSRRLESDAEAVQVLTIHRSKGLEFPIVFHPYLYEPSYVSRDPQPVLFHDPDHGDVRTLDVGLEGPDYARHRQRALAEQRGEDLRLAYVALTRARHQSVVWWAGSFESQHSALGRLLFARDDAGEVRPAGAGVPSDEAVLERLHALAARVPGAISVERVDGAAGARWQAPPRAPGELVAERFGRALDRAWRRTSYTDITAAAHVQARVDSEPEHDLLADEPEEAGAALGVAGSVDRALAAVECPLAGMAVGAAVGTVVHRAFEASDFAAADLAGELAAQLRLSGAVEIGDPAAVVDALPRRSPRRSAPGSTGCACATSGARTVWTSSPSSCRSGGSSSPTSPRCSSVICRPGTRCTAIRGGSPIPSCAARWPAFSPGASIWSCARGRATRSSTTRPTGWAERARR
ncbi:MAG TPA: UvrD-helicase domain-containing protein [Solirubrobacteraceae bacterium]|nr:UvrD-helicase domain-containing protein [Solirubrobacteraceae bacterium]